MSHKQGPCCRGTGWIGSDCQQRWIPVEERLPETRDPVLTLWVSGMQSVKQHDEQNGWNTGAQVTHWMPLPAPPNHVGDATEKEALP
jgi:hypothetical protein